jgi:hypothetical protein
MVFSTVRMPVSWVKIQTKFSTPMKRLPRLFIKAWTVVWMDG